MAVQEAAIVGAGTMGNGIAHVLALHGVNVTLIDVQSNALEQALQTIEKNLNRQVEKQTVETSDRDEALARIRTSDHLEEGVDGADLVIEAATESFDVKAAIFRQLDAAAARTAILASNTSSISITKLAAETGRPDRVIGMHFFNPVPVMSLVEIVRGLGSSDETFTTVEQLSRQLGKTPVEVQDYPGFVSNRVLMPMINEAIFCVMEGVASVEDVDTVMKLGMNHPMGPLRLADFIGLDVCLSIMEVLHEEIGDDKYRPCPLLRKMVTAGRLGRKSGSGFYEYA